MGSRPSSLPQVQGFGQRLGPAKHGQSRPSPMVNRVYGSAALDVDCGLPPINGEAVTFKERSGPEEKDGVEQAARDLETDSDGQWRRFYHILECSTEMGETQPVEMTTDLVLVLRRGIQLSKRRHHLLYHHVCQILTCFNQSLTLNRL